MAGLPPVVIDVIVTKENCFAVAYALAASKGATCSQLFAAAGILYKSHDIFLQRLARDLSKQLWMLAVRGKFGAQDIERARSIAIRQYKFRTMQDWPVIAVSA